MLWSPQGEELARLREYLERGGFLVVDDFHGEYEWQAFRDVLLPHMKPGLIAGGLLAFTLSLDDFVITFFTSGPNTITFPVKVYSMVRFSVTPEVNAASALLIALTVILTTIALKLQSRMGAVGQAH
ncbi:MAG: DUF4159 domain-containing protein [Akkermansiaceae bacterium]|nr:DUF4159 domain-containing protein [Akkermansiaceae bacterium]